MLKKLKESKSLVELSLTYFGTPNEMAECIVDALKDNKSLKTLDIMLYNGTSIEDRISFSKAIEKNTALEKIIFRKAEDDGYIIISDRILIENDTTSHKKNQSIEFQRLEIYLAWLESNL